MATFLVLGACMAAALAAAPAATGATAGTATAQPPSPPPSAAPAAASQGGEQTPTMTRYYFVLLRRGPQWKPKEAKDAVIEKMMEGHMANIQRLAGEGKLVLAGPFLDQTGPGSLAGLFVLNAASIEEARQLVATDPAVQAGRFQAEVIPWFGPTALAKLLKP